MRIDLADDEDVGPPAGDDFSDQFLGAALAVHLRGVDQRHTQVQPQAQGGALVPAFCPFSPIFQVPWPRVGTGLPFGNRKAFMGGFSLFRRNVADPRE